MVAINNSVPEGKITMSMVKESLLNEETRRSESGFETQSEVLVTERRGRSRTRHDKGDDNHDKSKGRSRSRNGGIKCYYCHKPGHIKRNCRKLKRSKSRERSEDKEEDKDKDTAAVVLDEELAIVTCDEECVNTISDDCTWVADSAATSHVTPYREMFSSYTHVSSGVVKMGNKDTCNIVGIGTVCLETNTGCKLVLKNVKHIPDIRLNLISTPVLDKEGYVNDFHDGKWKLLKGNLLMARGKLDSLYRTQAKVCKGEVNAFKDDFANL